MGLLDYYRQFQELSPREVSARLLEQRDERRRKELEVVRPLDLTATAWHEPPHPEIVNQATFALRRAVNAYPDADGRALRAALAERHGVAETSIAVGHGAGDLLQAALHALARAGEVVLPWPSWPALPVMVRRAGARPVPVPLAPDGTVDLDALLAATGPETRAAIVCTPNDPTGLALPADAPAALRDALPEQAWLLLDEALAEFRAPAAEATPLVAERPRVLALRSFSKAHAMAGFRIGYAVGSADADELVATLAPTQGVSAPAQAGALWAVEQGESSLARRRAAAARERERLAAALRATPFAFAPSETSFVWLASSRHGGPTIAAHLARRGVYVAPGSAWGDDRHVRVTLRDAPATERLAAALREPF